MLHFALSFHIYVANKTPQSRPTVMMPGERRILHLADPADPLAPNESQVRLTLD